MAEDYQELRRVQSRFQDPPQAARGIEEVVMERVELGGIGWSIFAMLTASVRKRASLLMSII